MQYIVTGQFIDPGVSLGIEKFEAMLESGILPTLATLAKLESEGKVVGGLPSGDRALAFILEARDNHEADQVIHDLPAWGLLKWEVRPLESFKNRLASDKLTLERLRAPVNA